MAFERRVPLARIIKNDFAAFLTLTSSCVSIVAVLAICFRVPMPKRNFTGTLDPDKIPGFLLPGFGVAAVVLLVLFVWRLYCVRYIVKQGFPCEAVITSVNFFGGKDRGRIEYCYEVDGMKYRGGAAVTRSGETNWRQQGDQITLLVHPTKYDKSVMASLFLKFD